MGWVVTSSADRGSVDCSTTTIARSRRASPGVWGYYEVVIRTSAAARIVVTAITWGSRSST